MRVTIASCGSHGDIRPVVALAVGLRARGHEAVVVTEEAGARLAVAEGVPFHALRTNIGDVLETSVSARGVASFEWRDREWLEAITAASRGSDVVVGLPLTSVHAMSAAEQVGAVGILAGLQPMEPTRDFLPSALGHRRVPRALNRPAGRALDAVGAAVILRRVNAARRELGLARMSNPYHRLPFLGGWSPVLVPTPPDWDLDTTVTGQWRLAPGEFEPSPALSAFLAAGDRPIYVGFGSLRGPRMTYAIEQVLEAYSRDYRILLASPYDGDVPDNVHRIGSVPHEWLFPRCGALVHHAGAGTTHAAARSGIPSIPVPFVLDQPFWADRLHRLGSATRPLDPRSGWEAYKAALRDTVPAREPAKHAAARLEAEDGVAAAVDAIERLAAS